MKYTSTDKDELIKKARVILADYQETLDLLDRVFGCTLKSSWNFGEVSTYTSQLNHDQLLLIKLEKFDEAFNLVDSVSNTINKLNQIYAEILLFKYRENYTIDQITSELHISRRSIYRYIQKAHIKFIQLYEIQGN